MQNDKKPNQVHLLPHHTLLILRVLPKVSQDLQKRKINFK